MEFPLLIDGRPSPRSGVVAAFVLQPDQLVLQLVGLAGHPEAGAKPAHPRGRCRDVVVVRGHVRGQQLRAVLAAGLGTRLRPAVPPAAGEAVAHGYMPPTG